MVFNLGPLDLEFSTFTTRPLLPNLVFLLTCKQFQGIVLKMSPLHLWGLNEPVYSPSYDQMQLQYFDLTLRYLERAFLDTAG